MATPYCLICHNIYIQTEEIAATPCGHVYHNECLTDWLQTSETCPQCRNQCTRNQVKRIYIDFADDEELAIAQTLREVKKPPNCDTDAEEMIKMLLEHIDGKSSDEQQTQQQQQQHLQQSQSDECELCIAFQEAYDKMATEKDQLAQVLNSIENENQSLSKRNTQTLKTIEELEMQIQSNEFQREQIEEKLRTSEKIVAAIQSQNVSNQHIIDDLNLTISKNAIQLNDLRDEAHRLNERIKEITSDYASEFQQLCHGIQYIVDGKQQRKLLKRYCDAMVFDKCQQTPTNDSSTTPATDTNANECQAIVPYCGNIDSWDYIMVPVIKK